MPRGASPGRKLSPEAGHQKHHAATKQTATKRPTGGASGSDDELEERVSGFCTEQRLDRPSNRDRPSSFQLFQFPTGEWFEVDTSALAISKCSQSLGEKWKARVTEDWASEQSADLVSLLATAVKARPSATTTTPARSTSVLAISALLVALVAAYGGTLSASPAAGTSNVDNGLDAFGAPPGLDSASAARAVGRESRAARCGPWT
jgi:hypothetical protein